MVNEEMVNGRKVQHRMVYVAVNLWGYVHNWYLAPSTLPVPGYYLTYQ
jgi:hypothetical protein